MNRIQNGLVLACLVLLGLFMVVGVRTISLQAALERQYEVNDSLSEFLVNSNKENADLVNENSLLTVEMVSLKEALQVYKKYDSVLEHVTSEDLEIIRKIVKQIGEVNQSVPHGTATRIALACVIADKKTSDAVPLPRILAMAQTESTFKVTAKSTANCKGLLQLSSLVWNVYSESCALAYASVYNPFANITVGATYLDALVDSHKGNRNKALQFYNAGSNFGPASRSYVAVLDKRTSYWKSVIN